MSDHQIPNFAITGLPGREAGYYWVLTFFPRWIVAEWDGALWRTCVGIDGATDRYFWEIGPRIEPPALPKPYQAGHVTDAQRLAWLAPRLLDDWVLEPIDPPRWDADSLREAIDAYLKIPTR